MKRLAWRVVYGASAVASWVLTPLSLLAIAAARAVHRWQERAETQLLYHSAIAKAARRRAARCAR